ncbi:MAG: GDP-L-fucose synthase [Clostridia bacterium]|nr:GDP-L-fucose synthase [Clostridia bacterium]
MKLDKNAPFYIAGHGGMVGSALLRRLKSAGFTNILTRDFPSLDLRDSAATDAFFESTRPRYVILAAARVGGILANQKAPADFLYDNCMIAMNVLHAAKEYGTEKLLFLGSSCIYPRDAAQPIKESSLLTGPLEQTNEGYALAKIAGLRYASYLRRQYGCDFISCMPTNLYGIGDNYHPTDSHVIPALIRRFHSAKEEGKASVSVLGTGRPLREFLFSEDLADAALFLMERYSDEQTVNVGSGEEVSIAELARLVARTVGYEGRIVFDESAPDGTPRKRLDTSVLDSLGWTAKTNLKEGLPVAYNDFLRADTRK